ncbi:TIGR03016 family PEP-CTERM system-associated outer membrane protein [Pseudoduganella sp. OTU4001]|uniref:TIGR03016 family PEP-CTERM system-associated outer membrane protein n=1 Tax=Pseudoduganella sp. OTU4001 TaxID=3043854 RepID=UPI00313AFEDA
MITTMVKRGGLALLPLAAGLCAAFPAQAAWDFTPVAGARATWSDNLTLQSDALAESGYVMEVTPGFSLANHSQRFDLRLDYALRLYKTSAARSNGAQNRSQDLGGALKSRLVDELLYFDARADIHQQAVSAFGPLASGTDYLNNNRSEVRSYHLSPYLVHRFGAFANGELRYVRDSVSSDNPGFRGSDGNILSAQLRSGPTFRRFGWDASLSRMVSDEEVPVAGGRNERQTTSSKGANLGLRYVASPQLNLGVYGGYDDYDFSGLGGSQSGAAYGASLEWVPSARTALRASAGHRFYGPSYSMDLTHRSRGTVWKLLYSDAVSSSRSQFSLPQAIDTAAMLDNLFRAQISDPLLRAAAVQAYMQSTGLPSSLAVPVNFLSNRYSLQKQLNATVIWQLARTTTTFSLMRMRREMLSKQQSDSVLLGSSLLALNDNTDQVSAMANVSYRLGPQTVANLMATAFNIESLSTGQRNQRRDLRFNLSRSFGGRLSGTLELRHVKGASGAGGPQFAENAVTVGLTSKF